ncbi:hypothetical protein [Thalassobaculum sp.]|uniref:hypothetical protein n=1 Tax=Thalassobaculum sp. TaxID=2022740 RepID=UPI0032EEDE43
MAIKHDSVTEESSLARSITTWRPENRAMLPVAGYHRARFGCIPCTQPVCAEDPMAKLYKFRRDDGSFDYDRYRATQIAANKAKLDAVFAIKDNIGYLAERVLEIRGPCTFGLCHGTRRGLEQQWFSEFLNCTVIGTEISDTAVQFPNTIQWDFHNVKDEWISETDFIYSNSWDHSYEPRYCFDQWVKCLKPGGLMILEHSSRHLPSTVNPVDPFGASIDDLVRLLNSWGNGRYGVHQVIETLPISTYDLAVSETVNHKVVDLRAVIVQKTN